MSLPNFSVRRPVTTIMFYLFVVLLGGIALTRLPQELFPPVAYPQLTVLTKYRDAAPEEIETLITKPIEEVVGTVSGLRRVSSISKEELSVVIAEFNWGRQMDYAALEVRSKIDLIKERLPRGSEDPVVIKFNPFELPVMVLNLSGEFTPHELLKIARKQVKNEIEKVEGVAVVNISGGLDREILVEVDQGRLQASGLPISHVVEALSRANLNYPAGTIKEAFYEYLIRTMGEFQLVSEIPTIAVGVEEEKEKTPRRPEQPERPGPLKRDKGVAPVQRMILMKDVAVVKDSFKERTSISRFNGKENVSLSIQAQAEANTLGVATRVKEALKKIIPSLPPGVRLDVAYDQSLFIRASIQGVQSAALQGGALAFLVLLAFLGNIGAALNVALAIPIAILATFAMMYFTGTSLNTLSLGGLAFGIGLLVDAGIVVVENIATHREKVKELKVAAVQGTQEVTAAIFGTVLTTVVVFLPLLFVVGLVGQFLKDFALTVTLSNLISLVVSLSLTALLASRIREGRWRSPLSPLIEGLSQLDETLVRWFLRHWVIGIGIVLALFGGALGILNSLDRELLPRIDQGQFIMRVTLPPGTRLEVTDRIVRRIEQVLMATPEVQDVSVTIGSSKEKRAEELLETLGPHEAQIPVNLKARPVRTRSTDQIVQELKETLTREPLEGAQMEYLLQTSVFKSTFLSGTPVVVEVKGQDLARLEKLSGEVSKLLEKIPGLFGVKTSLVPPSPETKVHVNKDRSAAYHLSVSDIALTAQTALKGFVATKFKQEGREIDTRVRLRKEDRQDLNKVRRLLVHSPLEIDVPLAEVAYFAVGKGPTEIRHLDQQRTLLVSAQLYGRPLNAVLEEVILALRGIKVPSGYTVELTGENQQMQESFRSLAFALVLSVILVYMVMASEFESLWQPFLIMGTIPMSVIGVAFILWLTQTPISVMVGVGLLVLGGVVVDNGIVLVDCVNQLRAQGADLEEAVVQASALRLRPILMTAATTVLGLLPLALGLGEGVELQTPMAITVMGGLTIATFLTLIFLPTLYYTGARFFLQFQRVPLAPPALEPAPAFAGVGLLAPETVPAPGPVPQPSYPPEIPEVPEGYGSEEVAPERPEGTFLFPAEGLLKPEPPAPPEVPPVPSPTLPEPLFEETEATPPPEIPPPEAPPAPPEVPLSEAPSVPSGGATPLNPRQMKGLEHLRIHGRISRKEYVGLTGASVPTAARDLKELVDRGLIQGIGPLARGRYYVLKEEQG